MAMKSVLLPALQGRLGSWHYYSALMKLSDLVDRVSYADEIHENTRLSEMIQRRLDEAKRSEDIEQYLLKTKDRFFNSLVVGVYGGSPQWHPFEVKVTNQSHAEIDMMQHEEGLVGYLELNGSERLFALDGQHRLSGIRRAIKKDSKLGDELVSVLFVPHSDTPAGLQRTRSLFVAINKKAVPVARRDIIALDEIDLAAIVTRRLVDTNPLFSKGQVDLDRFTQSIPAGAPALTTIGNLYDITKIALAEIIEDRDAAELANATRIRMSDDRIAHYEAQAAEYIKHLIELDPDLISAITQDDFGPSVIQQRRPDAARVLFRPIGLTIFTKVIAQLRKKHSLAEAMNEMNKVPLVMTEAPFEGVIWDSARERMNTGNASLCIGLLLYMLGEAPAEERLVNRYALVQGIAPEDVVLPSPFK
ncbi:DNA sulfur modification protein DndB [Devosia aurantiaca]|uniref:DGQHR domain-containing protein n=1 Tax=Devosia aurantiaca TaxID=2714858 RepID=A0A6M1SU57_9HYPH|nr:DNA sulfur modification protein DndB [Devosia aurantiaca]NGP16501.1 DGQHR domain-containing protein [Devosia aurantiaca]